MVRIAKPEPCFLALVHQFPREDQPTACQAWNELVSRPQSNLADPPQPFQHLTSFHFSPTRTTFRRLYTQLAKLLPKLSHLRLAIYFPSMLPDRKQTTHLPLPQLISLKSLYLQILCMTSHMNVAEMKISRTMPNLEQINVELVHSLCGCEDCDLEEFIDLDMFEVKLVREKCLGQVLEEWSAGCRQLKVIEHNLDLV